MFLEIHLLPAATYSKHEALEVFLFTKASYETTGIRKQASMYGLSHNFANEKSQAMSPPW